MHETGERHYERTSISTHNEPMAKELKKTSAGQEIVNVPLYEFLCKAAEKNTKKNEIFFKARNALVTIIIMLISLVGAPEHICTHAHTLNIRG